MSNYGVEYKAYYDGLKKKHNINGNSIDKSNDLNYIYRSNNLHYKNNNKSKESFIGNLIVMQLVGTIMLFLFVFGTKYSENENLKGYYLGFKQVIEQDYKSVNSRIDVEDTSLEDKFNLSLKWLKESGYKEGDTD